MILKISYGKKIHLINSQTKLTIQELKETISQLFKSLPHHYALSYIDEDGDQITLHDQQDYLILLGSQQKTIKVNIIEINEDFIEMTEKIQIEEQISQIKEKPEPSKQENNKPEEIVPQVEPIIPEIDESMIEEKLKKLLPDLISKVKSEISEELSERSRISNQPEITEDNIQEEKPIRNSFNKMKGEDEAPIIEEQTSVLIHKGITCDNCFKKDFSGARYKCSVCSNFDFCEECEATFEHPHPFLKIRNPKQAPLKIFTVINDEDNNLEVNGQKLNVPPGFEHLVHKGINFISSMFQPGGHHGRHGHHGHHGNHGNNENRRGQGCPFRKWKCNSEEKTETKPEQKTETKPEEKKTTIVQEKKVIAQVEKSEPKKQSAPFTTENEQNLFSEGDEQKVLKNAQYLATVGFDFSKCYQWAKTYHRLSAEELLEFCLSKEEFFN